MSASDSDSHRENLARSRRELEIELAKTRAEAQAAQLLAKAHALEAELERTKRAQAEGEQRSEQVADEAGGPSSAFSENTTRVPPQLNAPQPYLEEPEPHKPPVVRLSPPEPTPPSSKPQPSEPPPEAQPKQTIPGPPEPRAPNATPPVPPGAMTVEHAAGASAGIRPPEPSQTATPTTTEPAASVATDAVADEPADADDGDVGSDDEKQSKRRRFAAVAWLHDAPGWLVSTIFHALLVLLLGLFTITVTGPEDDERLLMAHIDGEEIDELVDSVLEDQLDDADLEETNAIPIEIQDPGLASLGDVSSVDTAATADVSGTMAMPEAIGDIGSMFGDDGEGWTTAGEGVGGAAEFFGVKATGNRFIFVVDGSKSMGKANKWEECKRELMVAISKLKKTQRFYVFLFAKDIYRMFGENDPTERMMLATPENIERLRYWLYDYELKLGTVPQGALEEALDKMRPSAIYLLSDGQFTDNGRSEKYLLDFAKEKNNVEDSETGHVFRVAVHTIAFHSKQGETVLKGVSDSFGSTFRYVPGAGGGGKGKKKKKAEIPLHPGAPVPNPR